MDGNIRKAALNTRFSAALALGILSVCSPMVTGASANHLFAAEVREVRSSSINGLQMLTLGIDGVEGPDGCRNSTVLLRTDVRHNNSQEPELEAIALRSFLNSEVVMISVPTDLGECINGMPAVNDMWAISSGKY